MTLHEDVPNIIIGIYPTGLDAIIADNPLNFYTIGGLLVIIISIMHFITPLSKESPTNEKREREQ